jgi:small subunit ribosomal protein S16
MLVIRFNRTGKKNIATFRIVLQERTQAPGKRHVEILGSYDPHKKTSVLKKERILYWIGQGAQTSPVVTNLLIRNGVVTGKKISKKIPRPVAKEEVKAEEPSAIVNDASETPKEEIPNETPVVKSEEKKIEETSVTPEVEVAEVAEAPSEVASVTTEPKV